MSATEAPMHPKYEVVIGLEVHVQLATKSKVFSWSSTAFGAEPNTQTDPVCLGMPGTLPVLNGNAVEAAVRLGRRAGAVHATGSGTRTPPRPGNKLPRREAGP